MSDYIRLAEAPKFVLQYPQCGACLIDLDHDGDGFVCPSCGTSWDSNAGDDDAGELYESWSGEELNGPIVSKEKAHLWGGYLQKLSSHKLFAGSEVAHLFPEPTKPGES